MSEMQSRLMKVANTRCLRLSQDTDQNITIPVSSYGYVKEIASENAIKEFVNNIAKSNANANAYCTEVLDLISSLNANIQKTLSAQIAADILPRVNPRKIVWLSENFDFSKLHYISAENIKQSLAEIQIVDRMIKNEQSISKRFNFDKVIHEENDGVMSDFYKRKNSDVIQELCEWIDTYDLTNEWKYNIALENIMFSFNKNKRRISVYELVEEVTKYFITKNPVVTDRDYMGYRKVLETNMLISELAELPPIAKRVLMSEDNTLYSDNYEALSHDCNGKLVNKLNIMKALKVKNENSASSYISSTFKMISESTDQKERQKMAIGMMCLPLLGNVSKAFVVSEMNIHLSKGDDKLFDKEFIDVMNSAFEDEYDLLGLSDILEEAAKNEFDKFSKYYKEPKFSLTESENFANSNDIKKILNDFEEDQQKSVGRFRRAIGKIYRQSPQNIIDDTPHILGVVRKIFILGSFAIPVVGPIIGIVSAFVDHLINSRINDKESAKLILALEKEREKVKKDMDKKKANRAELEKYDACLKKCIDKVDSYRQNITDNEIEGRQSGDDDLDFDFDFNFESAELISNINVISTLMENTTDDNIKQKTVKYLEGANIEYTQVFTELFSLINESRILSYQEMSQIRYPSRSSILAFMAINNLKRSAVNESAKEYRDINTMKQFIAYETVQEIINEEFSLNTLKLAMQNMKSKVKDLSTKEKSFWQTIDAHMSTFQRNVEKALTSDRREAIIKGSIIPSFSKCIKTAIMIGGLAFIDPVVALIGALGMFGASKALNAREKQLIFDEIETELKVVDKEIQLADNDGDMKRYRFLLQYQKKLERERQRIKYGMKVHGRDIPSSSAGRRDD